MDWLNYDKGPLARNAPKQYKSDGAQLLIVLIGKLWQGESVRFACHCFVEVQLQTWEYGIVAVTDENLLIAHCNSKGESFRWMQYKSFGLTGLSTRWRAAGVRNSGEFYPVFSVGVAGSPDIGVSAKDGERVLALIHESNNF